MTTIHSYPKVYNLGHPLIAKLLDGPVTVEEKVDGSQFSFSRIGNEIVCRSRGQQIQNDAPGMFALGVATVLNLGPYLRNGWVYRGEFLAKPKHNTLAYDRVPLRNIVLFDIETGDKAYLPREAKEAEALGLGLEIVPVLAREMPAMEQLQKILETRSCLGGQKIEGVVIKNYTQFGTDGKVLMGKFVSESFKETHRTDWKDRNPNHGDIIETIGQCLRTPARWEKAIQHLRERGELEGSPRDIGKLINEIQEDLGSECGPEIAEKLMRYAFPKIARTAIRGFAEWYKLRLAGAQFDSEEATK